LGTDHHPSATTPSKAAFPSEGAAMTTTTPTTQTMTPSTLGSLRLEDDDEALPVQDDIRVLFGDSPRRSRQQQPTPASSPDWKDHEVCGNLSMDSSLTSASSLEETKEATIPAAWGKGRIQALGGQWSRPRSLLLLLSVVGLCFSGLTFLLSISIMDHPAASSSTTTEAQLKSRFLSRPTHVRKRATQVGVSLTALAQGQQDLPRGVAPPADLVTHHETASRHAQSPPAAPILARWPSVAAPTDWRSHDVVRQDRAELRFFHDVEAAATHTPRVSFLYDPSLSSSSRHAGALPRYLVQYPADFTDQTQLYSILDSSDERIKGMELRSPYVEGDCVPMADWQTSFYPSCNAVHELGLAQVGQGPETSFDLFGKKGYWRNAWKVKGNKGDDVFVLKTLKIEHNFEEAHFEHDRVDAVAMERLTGSPHVIDIFGFCGHSVLTEYADGKRLGSVADKSRKTPLARLQMAVDIAHGLADVHGIDGDDKVSFVHLDVNPANVVIVDDKLKLNDFNIGIIRRRNVTSNEPCGFPAQYPNPQWRSPEEARNEDNLTEKVDIFSLGHIFFRLICGHEPWNRLEAGGKPSKELVTEKVQQGILPVIPNEISLSSNPEIVAVREAMLRCYEKEPRDRPSAREIATDLESELNRLKGTI
jgi:serine/threonine protein kinase